MNTTGKFIISLDFELLWGVRDKKTPKTYGENILGAWKAIPKMLKAFEKHKVKATWAIVGFLFASSKKELLDYCPSNKPNYINKNLSPYNGHFGLLGEKEDDDRYHFASKLIDVILKHPEQEIATHTFSHYYCLEPGQTKDDFKSDTLATLKIAKKKNIKIESLVFPRNQFNYEYLEMLKKLGITSYRGNERAWFYNATKGDEEKWRKRAFRLLDAYVNISGHNCYSIEEISKKEPYDIPSSRFLRPYSSKLKILEGLRLHRILKSMTYAAKKGKVFHLWWHPHNFGINQKENFNFLNKVLNHYTFLNQKNSFQSITMSELSNNISCLKNEYKRNN